MKETCPSERILRVGGRMHQFSLLKLSCFLVAPRRFETRIQLPIPRCWASHFVLHRRFLPHPGPVSTLAFSLQPLAFAPCPGPASPVPASRRLDTPSIPMPILRCEEVIQGSCSTCLAAISKQLKASQSFMSRLTWRRVLAFWAAHSSALPWFCSFRKIKSATNFERSPLGT